MGEWSSDCTEGVVGGGGALFRLIFFSTAEVFKIALLCFDWPSSSSALNMMEVPPCKINKSIKIHPSLQGRDFFFFFRTFMRRKAQVFPWNCQHMEKNGTASIFRLVCVYVCSCTSAWKNYLQKQNSCLDENILNYICSGSTAGDRIKGSILFHIFVCWRVQENHFHDKTFLRERNIWIRLYVCVRSFPKRGIPTDS